MVKIEQFQIDFIEKWALYHPEDNVNGKITLKLNEPYDCDCVTVLFYGAARVFWVEREIQGIAYSSEHVYFNDTRILWSYTNPGGNAIIDTNFNPVSANSEESKRRGILDRGNHEFEFSYKLPTNLATSFETKYAPGYVRFSVKVCLCKENVIKYSRKVYFSVVKPENLNDRRFLREPITKTFHSRKNHVFSSFIRFGCFLPNVEDEKQEQVTIKIHVSKQGYVPGEQIQFFAEVDNRSNNVIRLLKAHLVQLVTAYAVNPDFKTKDCSKEIASVTKKVKMVKDNSDSWIGACLYVPAVVPTFAITSVLDVDYVLRLEAWVGKKSCILRADIPIIIGTVPLTGELETSITPGQPLPAYDNYAMDIPPPTYEESITGYNGVDNETNYIPRYAVYKRLYSTE